VSSRLIAGTLIALLAGAATHAQVVDPVEVEAVGIVPASQEIRVSPRDAAFRAALTEAVVEAARRIVSAPVFAAAEPEIRASIEPRAASFVLNYRPGALTTRASSDPNAGEAAEEWVLPLVATVDARKLREFLRSAGWGAQDASRASLAVCVRPGEGFEERSASALAGLQRYTSEALAARDFVVVEPGLRAGGLSCDFGALELARALGADVAVDVSVSWRPGRSVSGVSGGVADVQVRASRAVDGAALAISRFQGAGHHIVTDEAIERALEAVRDQVVENVVLQLSRNWAEVARGTDSIELELIDVGSLLEVDAVRELLRARLAATQARVSALGPRSASLTVETRLSAGSLGDRLSSVRFDAFELEPVSIQPDRVTMRVRPMRVELDEP
jgi:hypothetical protein